MSYICQDMAGYLCHMSRYDRIHRPYVKIWQDTCAICQDMTGYIGHMSGYDRILVPYVKIWQDTCAICQDMTGHLRHLSRYGIDHMMEDYKTMKLRLMRKESFSRRNSTIDRVVIHQVFCVIPAITWLKIKKIWIKLPETYQICSNYEMF